MSKKKNKNKNRGVYQNPYQVDDQYLERVMKGADLSIEDDDPYDYVIDPNHPKAQGANNAPATRSNLKSNASYKDFVNASKEKPVYKPKTPKEIFGAMGQPDLRTFLADIVDGDRSEEETRREVERYTMSDPSMEAYAEEIEEEEVEEYDEDDPYRMDPDIDPEEIDMGLMPGVMPNDDDLFDRVFADEAEEEVEPSAETIQEEIVEEVTEDAVEEVEESADVNLTVPDSQDDPMPIPDDVESEEFSYPLYSDIASLKMHYFKGLHRLTLDDNISPISFQMDRMVRDIIQNQFTEGYSEIPGLIVKEEDSVECGYDHYQDMVRGFKEFLILQMHPAAVYDDGDFLEKFAKYTRIDTNSFRFVYQICQWREDDYVYAYHIPKRCEGEWNAFVKDAAKLLSSDPEFMNPDAYGWEDQPYYIDSNGNKKNGVGLVAELCIYYYMIRAFQKNSCGLLIGNDAYMNAFTSDSAVNLTEVIELLIAHNMRSRTMEVHLETDGCDADEVFDRLNVLSASDIYDHMQVVERFLFMVDEDEDAPTDRPKNPLKEAYEMYVAVAKQNNQKPMEFDEFVKSVTLAEIDNPVFGTPVQEAEDLPETPSREVDLSAPTAANKDIGSNVMAEALGKALEPDQDGSMVIPVRRKH